VIQRLRGTEARMARAYGQDLRERVVDAALSGLSARQAAERFGVGISTAIVWVRRARAGERTARRQGQPKGSKLDAYADYVLDLVAETPHIRLKEMQARLAEEKSVSAGVGTIWRFFATRAITFKKARSAKLAGTLAVPRRPGRHPGCGGSGCAGSGHAAGGRDAGGVRSIAPG
jgi:transposase